MRTELNVNVEKQDRGKRIVALPAILYTGKQYVPPKAVLKQLVNMQKQFVWHAQTGTGTCQHKINPALVYTPLNAGGLGLHDIERALKATRANLAERWLQESSDAYTAAWHAAAHPGQEVNDYCCVFRPTSEEMVHAVLREKEGLPRVSAQGLGKLELWQAQSQCLITTDMGGKGIQSTEPRDINKNDCNWIDDDTMHFTTTANPWRAQLPPQAAFLLRAPWDNNACVLDEQGKPLRVTDYPTVQQCRLQEVIVYGSHEIHENREHSILIRPPRTSANRKTKTKSNVQQWCKIMLTNIPWNLWGTSTEPPEPSALPTLQSRLQWEIQNVGGNPTIAASRTREEKMTVLHFKRNFDGFTWRITWVDADYQQTEDFQEMKAWERVMGFAFTSTPDTAIYPWIAPPGIMARNLAKTLRKQRSDTFKRHLRVQLQPALGKIQQRKTASSWGRAAQQQSPQQIWDHQGLFTDFQNWTIYRIAIGALNLRHDGWPSDRTCPDEECATQIESIDHILWDCSKAEKAEKAWMAWINKWMGKTTTSEQKEELRTAAAARAAPPIQTAFLAKSQQCIGRWTPHHTEAMRLLWKIWATVTPVLLWRLRNEAIFEGKVTAERETQAAIMTAGAYQTRAIASAWRKQPAKRIQGECLSMCHSIMMTIDAEADIPDLKSWNIHFCSHTAKDKHTTGGWVMYHDPTGHKWKPTAAGSLRLGTTTNGIDKAASTLQQAVTQLLTMTTPDSTYLRVDSLDKKLQAHLHQLKLFPQDNSPANALAQMMDSFFSVQWGKPAGSAYRAAQLMAKTSKTTIYNTQSTGGETIPSHHVRSSIAASSPQAQSQHYPKTNDILSRLTTYKASIEQ